MSAMPAEKLEEEFYAEEETKQFFPIEPPFEPEDLAPRQDWRLDLEAILELADTWKNEKILTYANRHNLSVDVTEITEGELNYYKFLREKEIINNNYFQDVIDPSKQKYQVKGYLGRGAWGIVLEAYDNVRHETVAIKLFAPNEIGAEQASLRNVDEWSGIHKEVGTTYPLRNVTPRFIDYTPDGRPMIVMGKYDKFLSDILEEAKKDSFGKFTINGIIHKRFASGLNEDDLRKYALQIANGVREIHLKYNKAHCDLHENNIAVEDTLDREKNMLINDLGTSTFMTATYASMGDDRQNLGWMYIRAPELWFPEFERPKKQDDIYSFGSLLDAMVSGKHTLEDEINEAFKKGSEENGISGAISEITKLHRSMRENDNEKLIKYLQKKHKKLRVPKALSELIQECVKGGIVTQGGEHNLLYKVKHAFEEYDKSKFWKGVRELVVDGSKTLAATLTAGTLFFTSCGVGMKYGCAPIASQGYDLDTRIEKASRLGTDLRYEVEGVYPKLPPHPDSMKEKSRYYDYLKQHQEKYGDEAPADIMVSHLFRAMIDQDIPMARMMLHGVPERFREMYPEKFKLVQSGELEAFEMYRYLFANALYNNELVYQGFKEEFIPGKRVDLEDACVETLNGREHLIRMMKINNSGDFADSYDEKGDMDYGIGVEVGLLVPRWIHYIQQDPRLKDQLRVAKKDIPVSFGAETYNPDGTHKSTYD